MSFSYGAPDQKPENEVRFLVGDTSEKRHYLEDEELTYLLKKNGGNVNVAAIRACEAICAKLARSRDESVGSISVSLSQMFDNYQRLLSMLRDQYAQSGGIVPYAGGISLSDKQAARNDRDWNRPDFASDMFQRGYGPFATPGWRTRDGEY